MSVLDNDFPDFVRSVLDEYEGSDASECEDENDPDYDSEHDTDSGQEYDSEEEGENGNQGSDPLYFCGKNGCKWFVTELNKNTITPEHNIVMNVPTLKGDTRDLGNTCSPIQAWECLFTEDMISEIVRHTNTKIPSYRSNFTDEARTELKDTNSTELRALFAFLYYTAIFKSNHESLESMFATDGTGRDIFCAILSMRGIYVLLYCLRFDDVTIRETRKESDPHAAISHIYQRMVDNSQASYNICSYACVDEMLVGFRGRYKFRVYMASKPEKHGIKIMILSDAKTNYLLNAYIYI